MITVSTNEDSCSIYGLDECIDDAEFHSMKDKLAFQENLLASVHDAILAVDENLVIIYYNKMCEKLTGWPVGEVMGRSGQELFVKMDVDIPWEKIIAILNSNRHYTVEMSSRRKDGELFHSEVSIQRIIGSSGGYKGTVATFRDITERKLAEQALKESEKQARIIADELEKKNKLITDFFINISHEFRTPISILMLGIDLLDKELKQCGGNSGHFMKNTAVMRQNAFRLGRLVSNLLDIAKLDAGFMEPMWEMRNIIEWLGFLVKSTELYAMQKGISLKFNCAADEKWMFTDGFMLDRIILNLLSNSIKHTSPGGQITVMCKTADDHIKITVADNGEGIPEDKKSIIFDRFRQVNTSLTRASEGSGIGLALTKSLVELLGGQISFESAAGAGSQFHIELPVLQIEKAKQPVAQNNMVLDKRIQMELSDIIY